MAQALSAGPPSSAELARERGVDADALHRLLRALASDGIFEETEPGVFRNTAASSFALSQATPLSRLTRAMRRKEQS